MKSLRPFRRAYVRALEERLRMQEILLLDIDHRSKNAFQLASSMLSLKAKQVGSPEACEALKSAANQLVSFSAAHALLHDGGDCVEMRQYLALLAKALQADGQPVTIRLEAEPGEWRLRKALPLGLLASELVLNALKHGFPDGRRGEILIVLKAEPDKIVFSVSDNGEGWTHERRSGSGSRLISGLAGQIGGAIEAGSTPGAGAAVRLVIPKDGFDGLVTEKPEEGLDGPGRHQANAGG